MTALPLSCMSMECKEVYKSLYTTHIYSPNGKRLPDLNASLTGIVILLVLMRVWPFLVQDTCDSGTPLDAVQFRVVVSPISSDYFSATTITSGATACA